MIQKFSYHPRTNKGQMRPTMIKPVSQLQSFILSALLKEDFEREIS